MSARTAAARSSSAGFGFRISLVLLTLATLAITLINIRHYGATLAPALESWKSGHDSAIKDVVAPVVTIVGWLAVFSPAIIVFAALDDLLAGQRVRLGLIWSVGITFALVWVGMNLGAGALQRPVSVSDLTGSSTRTAHKIDRWAKGKCRGHGGRVSVSEATNYGILSFGERVLSVTCADGYTLDTGPFDEFNSSLRVK